jgi:hypothetical protein
MQVTWALRDDERVQARETFTVEHPIQSSEPGDAGTIAAALAEAFDESVRHVAARVMVALAAQRSTAE